MKFVIEVHHYHHGNGAVGGEVLDKLDELSRQLKRGFQMVRQDIKDFAAEVDVATTAIGDRIDRLVANSASLTAEEKAELGRLSANLKSMASDPENPVEPLPPA